MTVSRLGNIIFFLSTPNLSAVSCIAALSNAGSTLFILSCISSLIFFCWALKAANIIQSYLPQSGAVINQLQADKTLGGVTGTSEPVIIDNSSQPTIINQTNIASPQTRGNPLPGMGRDLGVTHLKYG